MIERRDQLKLIFQIQTAKLKSVQNVDGVGSIKDQPGTGFCQFLIESKFGIYLKIFRITRS